MAVIADPTGAVFGVWQARDSIGATVVNDPGCLTSNELSTSDPARASEFYSALFGWRFNEQDTQGGPPYWTIEHDGAVRGANGGMRELAPQQREAGIPPHWMPYFTVVSVDDAIATTKDAGGTIIAGPIEIPPGRIAVLGDPQGAVFGIFEGEVDDQDVAALRSPAATGAASSPGPRWRAPPQLPARTRPGSRRSPPRRLRRGAEADSRSKNAERPHRDAPALLRTRSMTARARDGKRSENAAPMASAPAIATGRDSARRIATSPAASTRPAPATQGAGPNRSGSQPPNTLAATTVAANAEHLGPVADVALVEVEDQEGGDGCSRPCPSRPEPEHRRLAGDQCDGRSDRRAA